MVLGRGVRKWVKKRVQNSREMKVSVMRRDCEVWVARMPTGDFTGVRGEVLRWYLWALALHWPPMWYDAKIARGVLI